MLMHINSPSLAYRLHWQSLHASIDNEAREIEWQLRMYSEKFDEQRRRLAVALVHVPGNSLEETIIADLDIRKELRSLEYGDVLDCEFDVICNGEELPNSAEFYGQEAYGQGRSIRVQVPVRFECEGTTVVLGHLVKAFTGWVVSE